MSLKLACPRCRHVQFFDDALAGEPASCAKCAQAFRVPRLTESAPEEAPPLAMAWPSPGQLQARELPATFAPPEIAAVQVVEVPVQAPKHLGYEEIDEPVSTTTVEPARRTRNEGLRTRAYRDEPSQRPWTIGVSVIAFILLMFVATAAWFLLRNDQRPPDPRAQQQFPGQFAPPVQQPQVRQQPFPPQQFPPGVQQQKGRGWLNLQKGQMVVVAPQGNEQLTPIKLVKGEAKVRGSINFNDATDPLSPRCYRKVYVVELEAKRSYTIEMNADPPQPGGGFRVRRGQALPFFDPFLRLEDEQGKILDWKDDILDGINLDSRIQIEIPAKGKYRIIATTFGENETGDFFLTIRDDNVGLPVVAPPLPVLMVPQPIKVDAQPPAEKTATRNLSVTTVFESETRLVGDLCRSADGKSVFVLDENGAVRRIAWKAGVEELRLETGLEVGSMSISRAGLLVSFPTMEEVWVIDPDSLQVKQRISAPGVRHVTAAPTSDIAYAAVKAKSPPKVNVEPPEQQLPAPRPKGGAFMPPFGVPTKLQPTDLIMVLDAAKAQAVRQYDFSPKLLTMTPDGNYLFAEGGIEALVRYKIDGTELSRDLSSPRLAGKGQGIFISPDSKYVCLTSPGGNYATDPNENLPIYTTLIFKTDDLEKPALAVQTGESPRTIGFDAKSNSIYGHNNDTQFMRFSQTGIKLLEENLPGDDRAARMPRQFLADPDGRHVLIRTERSVLNVELLKQAAP